MQTPGAVKCWRGRDRGAEAIPGKVPAVEVVDVSMTKAQAEAFETVPV